MRKSGHWQGEPGEQEDPLQQQKKHGHDVGDSAVACAPVELDGLAGEDEKVRPAGRKLSRITTFSRKAEELGDDSHVPGRAGAKGDNGGGCILAD